MVTAHYPGAESKPKPAGGGDFDHIEKLVLHTTETTGLPGYGNFAPHVTYDPWLHRFFQHVPFNKSSTTLVDASSTKVRENRDFCVQVEIVGYCDPKYNKPGGHGIDYIDDRAVRELGEFAAWLHKTGGLRLALIKGWLPYPKSYGNTANRLNGEQFDAFQGILGHEHVSTNVHGDPGAPPWLSKFLAYAKAAAGQIDEPAQPGMEGKFVEDIYINYEGNQALVAGDNVVIISDKGSKTLVIGPNSGVDVVATLIFESPVQAAQSFFRVVSYKDGTPTTTISSRRPTRGDQVTFKGDISKDKDGRSPRLRLVIVLPDGAVGVLKAVQITGWKM